MDSCRRARAIQVDHAAGGAYTLHRRNGGRAGAVHRWKLAAPVGAAKVSNSAQVLGGAWDGDPEFGTAELCAV